MTFGGDPAARGVTIDGAREILDVCLDAGVNLVDTADIYSDTVSESILGKAIAGRRDRLLIATKARFPTSGDPNDQGLSKAHLIDACEAALKRLKTDRIDLYQVHAWDGWTALEDTFEALDLLTRQGKIRYTGCSNFSAWHLYKAKEAAATARCAYFASQQIYYSPVGRDAERELLPASIDLGLGNLVWSPLAGGLMTGKYRRDQPWPAGARHSSDWDEPPIDDWNYVYDVIDAIVTEADAAGMTPAQTALAYLLAKPQITSLIVGARSRGQIEDSLNASESVLDPEAVDRLDRVSARPLQYPYWHQARTLGGRLGPADRVALRL
ncbi:MAG: aldo/keto reductase [Bifidobacteriaceae bacterium]|jgi:aryl-alcohol dehydrogenase-like predicted oxidoreductase|nr:aldo/keto reductase [Bifidobacteriaceae bacterium]